VQKIKMASFKQQIHPNHNALLSARIENKVLPVRKKARKEKEMRLFLTPEQKEHYNNCPYEETCEFCNWATKKLNSGYEM
jgi:hypothetical protein